VHLCRTRELAEDLAQETFLRALGAWGSYDPRRGPALVWLLAIARRVHLDHVRAEGRRRARETRYAAMHAEDAPPPELPTGLSPDVRAALEQLTAGEREVVVLRLVLALGGAETAALLGISATACSTTLHRAMTKMRRELGARGFAA
jgi:RNA polymerase sigma-70 factor, ECF subfamily